MHEHLWGRLKHALADLTEEEIHWRPLPQANTINVISRHLRIEAQWHLDTLERGAPMPTVAVAAPQDAIDAVPADFEANVTRLNGVYDRVMEDMLLVRGHVPEPIMVHDGTPPPILFDQQGLVTRHFL